MQLDDMASQAHNGAPAAFARAPRRRDIIVECFLGLGGHFLAEL